MAPYYFVFLIISQYLVSSYTVEDYFADRDHLKRSYKMLNDGDQKTLKKYFTTELFKKAMGYPDPKNGFPLGYLEKKALRLAHENGACCNPKIGYQGCDADSKEARFRHDLAIYLIMYHKVPQYRDACASKLWYLFKNCNLDVNQDCNGNSLFRFVLSKDTLELLLSFGLDIEQVDDKGRNFAMQIHCTIPQLNGKETKHQLDLKRQFFNHIQDMADYFYENGGDPFVKDNEGNTILHYVIWYGFHFLTESQLKSLMNTFNIDYKGRNFAMQIHCAIPPFDGNETVHQLNLKRKFFNNIQWMTDYFYENGGNLFAKDNEGNIILHYVIWHGFHFLTVERIKFLMDKFSPLTLSHKFKQEFLLSLANDDFSFYLTQFKPEWDTLSVLRRKLNELKKTRQELRDLAKKSDQESKKGIKKRLNGVNRLIKDIYANVHEESAKSKKRFEHITEYIKYMGFIFHFLLENHFAIIDQKLHWKLKDWARSLNNDDDPGPMLFKDIKTIHALLYYFIIDKAAKRNVGTIPENNIVFSIIVYEKLRQYSTSSDYKKVLKMYKSAEKK